MMNAPPTRLEDVLFERTGALRTYVILDGASIPELPKVLEELGPEYLCLFRGEVEPELAEVAPYLVGLRRGEAFTEWLLREGRGKPWGVFALSKADPYVLAAHLTGLLVADVPDGDKLYFRFYDPRVLKIFLPTCNKQQREQMFGPVSTFVLELPDNDSVEVFHK
jgi:hypothetical protein